MSEAPRRQAHHDCPWCFGDGHVALAFSATALLALAHAPMSRSNRNAFKELYGPRLRGYIARTTRPTVLVAEQQTPAPVETRRVPSRNSDDHAVGLLRSASGTRTEVKISCWWTKVREMAQGIVLRPFSDKGYTFVEPVTADANTQDVFLHVKSLEPGQDAKEYVRGALVEYEVVLVSKDGVEKPQAQGVRLVRSPDEGTGDKRTHGGKVKFWTPLSYGFVTDSSTDEELFVHSTSVPGGYLRDGDQIEFGVEELDDGKRQAVNVRVVDWSPTGDPFIDTLDMGHPSWATRLAEIAEPENWNYEIRPVKDSCVILRNYVKYTFLRLHELTDHVVVASNEKHLAFNTGLVSTFQEEIFALFSAADGKVGPRWQLDGFEKASSYWLLKLYGGNLPPLAWYFDHPSQLVYDTDLKLSVNVEHVPHDPDRFPDSLKSLPPQDLAALVNAKAPEAIERVRRNYKTAIPQFYRDGNTGIAKMQLLLPVALLSRDNVELALAVDRLDSGVYLGRTPLPLDWAYNNARLLTRPDKDWLRP